MSTFAESNRNSMKLYIIGNGFDIHHRMNMSYSHFKDYLRENDPETHGLIEQYLYYNDTDALWKDFENDLQNLDTDTILDHARNYLNDYGADDWSDDDHHVYQRVISEVIDPILDGLKRNFVNWVQQIQIPPIKGRVEMDPQGLFLNFNYTDTLEQVYKIDHLRILHIHGRANGENPVIVFGHGYIPPDENAKLEKLKTELSSEEFAKLREHYYDSEDPRVYEGEQIVRSYSEKTRKKTEQIISENEAFFDSMSDVDEVYIMGHSLSKVDMPYFEEVMQSVKNDARFFISYHKECEKTSFPKKLENLGIDKNRISIFELDPSAPRNQKLFCV